MNPDGIAIVGMSGRFPGAGDVDAFWNNIKNGVESVTHFTPEQLDVPAPPLERGGADTSFVCAKGVLEGVDLFDARFFGYLPREAELMDPQHRVFLELCSQAIEHAGYDPQRYPGSIGVYGGCYMDTYLMSNLCSNPEFLAKLIESVQIGSLQTELGNDKDYLATRVAFKLGLRGPAMTLQSACSTSLVAIATACQAIASYQCDMALAGGVTIVLPQYRGYHYREGGMLSPDGHCRTFDEHSAGTVFSNGAAVVLLKRVEDAVADGDTIYAVIRGYAINNDGGGKVSYTAPSVEGQAEVISLALASADIDARSIGYVEAHGTATPIGDPIEVAGLSTAFRAHTADKGFCAIGSVKANLGHLDVASGAIGLIKTAMAIHEGLLPPAINFTRPNPKIDFANSPFYVNTQLRPWPEPERPRRAGVSSFGVGGTNAHVVLEQAPAPLPTGRRRSHCMLPLSARTETALAAQSGQLADFLARHPDISLDDVAHTLQVGRCQYEHRRVVVACDAAEAAEKLRGGAAPGDVNHLRASQPKLVLMFPGQGAQYPGMARVLHDSEPVFREVIDQCCKALDDDGEAAAQNPRPYLLWDPRQSGIDASQASAALAQTQVAQPALFAMEMALTRLLESWGIRPDALMGHSVGEFTAACVAGVFGIEDAMRLVAARGRLMQAQPGGRMLAVRASASQLAGLMPEGVAIASINAPELTVVSGATDVVDTLAGSLEQQGIKCSALLTSHAFHSPMMAPVRAPLAAAVAAVPRQPATLAIISTALARVADPAQWCDPDYWAQQLMSPVNFAGSVAVAASDAPCILLEVGPGQTLGTLARQCLPAEKRGAVVACLGPIQSPGSDVAHLVLAVGRLWAAGAAPDWSGFQAGQRQRVALPTYPFERKRFWVEPTRLDLGRVRADACVPGIPVHEQLSMRTAEHDAAEADFAGSVEQLIQQQMVLVSQQIQLLVEASTDRHVP